MRQMIRLSGPVILVYFGQMTMHLVDLLFVGRTDATAIGVVGIGNSFFSWFMVLVIGLLAGLDYLISHAHGARQDQEARKWFVQGLVLTLASSIPLTLVLLFLGENLSWFGINPSLVDSSATYLRLISFSLVPFMIFNTCRQYLQALGNTKPAMVILILANVVNAVANYVFVLGNWGMPALSASGAALATLISRVLMMLMILGVLYVWERQRGGETFWQLPLRPEGKRLLRMFKMGIPAALQMIFEVGVFAVVTLLAARLSANEIAAHQIVLNIVSMTFTIPLGVSSATAVLVGQAMGRGDRGAAVLTGWRGLGLGMSFMFFSCLVLLFFPTGILRLYTTDLNVIEIGKMILFLGGIFQLFDGAQVVATGALRGIGNTRTPMLVNFAGYWILGLPMGAFLCFSYGWNLTGLWIGLSTGLILIALSLLWAWRYHTNSLRDCC